MQFQTSLLLFIAADFAQWALSYGRVYALVRGANPDRYACLEGCLGFALLFWGFDVATTYHGWQRYLIIGLGGVVPLLARRALQKKTERG